MILFSKNKINFRFYAFLSLVGIGLFLSIFFIAEKKAFALSSNYSKSANDALPVAEWNELANDFLAKSGGIDGFMSGELDANNNSIAAVGVLTDSLGLTTKSYVDGVVSSFGGGAVFTNWGRSDCPVGAQELYNGFGFAGAYNHGDSGGSLCIQSAPSGPFFSSAAI